MYTLISLQTTKYEFEIQINLNSRHYQGILIVKETKETLISRRRKINLIQCRAIIASEGAASRAKNAEPLT